MAKNIWSLREVLFNEMEELQSGKSTPQRANAMANLAGKILESATLEVGYGKNLRKAIEDKALIT